MPFFSPQVGDLAALKGDAKDAMLRFVKEGGTVTPLDENFGIDCAETDVIVDGLFGTG